MRHARLFVFFISLATFAMGQPTLKHVVLKCDSSATHGFYFLSSGDNFLIIDSFGNKVYSRRGGNGFNFNLWPDGRLTFTTTKMAYIMDSTFTIRDSIQCQHVMENDPHEFQILPNGHYLMLGNDTCRMDLRNYTWKQVHGFDTSLVRYSVIQEFDQNKKLVFEWRAKDHFPFDEVDTNYLLIPDVVDWSHINAVEVANDNNFLVSFRNFNEIVKVNRQTGQIMWRLGGAHSDFKFLNDTIPFYAQHDIRCLPNGHITLFDGGNNIKRWHAARAVEYELDEQKKTALLVWTYTYDQDMYSKRLGNVQRLANGNTLVNFGFVYCDDIAFNVVTPDNTVVFQVDGFKSYRAHNYASLPFKIIQPVVTRSDIDGKVILDAGPGYKTYLWNNGEKTRTLEVKKTGYYTCSVPYGDGGLVTSHPFWVLINPDKK